MTPHWTDLRQELQHWVLTSPRVLIGCDFDGTLAPIVDHAEQAALPEEARRALERLRDLAGVQVAIISGRSLADLHQRVGISGLHYAGNHGLEMRPHHGAEILAPGAGVGQMKLRETLEQLEAILPRVPGVWVEDKHWTASVHYRLAAEEHHALVGQLVNTTLEGISELTLRQGLRTWEIRPSIQWNKGTALTWFMEQCGVPVPGTAFLGDDVTDLDAFAVIAGGWPCVVGDHMPAPSAHMCVRDPADTADFLTWMADVRMSAF